MPCRTFLLTAVSQNIYSQHAHTVATVARLFHRSRMRVQIWCSGTSRPGVRTSRSLDLNMLTCDFKHNDSENEIIYNFRNAVFGSYKINDCKNQEYSTLNISSSSETRWMVLADIFHRFKM